MTIVCANPDGMTGARDELGPGRVRGPPRHRDVVVGGRRAAAALAAGLRPRRRGVGRLALRRRPARGGVAGPGRARPARGARAPVAADVGREELGLPDGLPVRLRLRLRERRRAQEPARAHRGLRARVPGRGRRRPVARAQDARRRASRRASTREVLAAAAAHPRITVLDCHLPAAEKNALIRELDCYVSLHRSEGFGLTIAEAMAARHAGHRDGLRRHARPADGVQQPARRPPAGRRSAPATIPTPRTASGPSPTSTTPRCSCAARTPTPPAPVPGRGAPAPTCSPATPPRSPAARWPTGSRAS